jgi:hypothetical protein
MAGKERMDRYNPVEKARKITEREFPVITVDQVQQLMSSGVVWSHIQSHWYACSCRSICHLVEQTDDVLSSCRV